MTTTGSGGRGLPSATVAALRCSVCADELGQDGLALRCPRGHSFDLAKQGYVNLRRAGVDAGTADTPEMVAARVAFLGSGHYAPLSQSLTATAAGLAPGLVLDAGAGTGHYLAEVLDAVPDATGLALDVSAAALKRAARAHPRIGAVVWNLWQDWPVASGAADLVLNVFAPRNAAEFHRVLRPGGTLLVASPGPGHLAELATALGLLDVDQDKEQRLDSTLGGHFELADRIERGTRLVLEPEQARQAVLMGPNAHHLHRDGLGERLAALTEPVTTTASFVVSTYRPRAEAVTR
ncbi:23S rRNA m(1)G-748 methyltransferase [Amycolatopsis marina]|uniref:23S rRNA m(1)G-748 methyltransferase n=1 Tax=Amycolatopsis marina TaxID=490629 RepID=A0A1I0WQM9_9PSEU|nr:methyltransferase domain-containing protein [Amycolatopsis marina]SFA90273.1 23S rRNA m(1)G-748 methyltransferase [Amycolatopsis marina]